MKQEQIKTLLINIITGVIVVAVLVVGYFVFTKDKSAVLGVVPSMSTETVAETTALIGTKIEGTVLGLKKLHVAVEEAATVFDMMAFKNLTDFSVGIPNQKIGRENPFVPTEWKFRMNALKDAMKKSPTQGASEQAASATFQSETQAEIIKTQTQGDLSGDIDPAASQNP